MKKLAAVLLTVCMVLSMAACSSKPAESTTVAATGAVGTQATVTEPAPAEPVELNVVTTFYGEDGNAQNFKDAVAAWEAATGNTVLDGSATSNEEFKARVATDFETGSEPDVLFFFNGADANSFIEAGKVVSIDEIRAEYPEYASNMEDGRIVASIVDGVKYAVPVNGFWEAMFVNKEVLDAAGVAVPGADYTWEQFLADCEKIKTAGFTPIAAALGEVPHYWWEFSIFNHTTPETHLNVPTSIEEDNGPAWVQGMNDVKALYEAGYFPANTNSAKDAETFELFVNGEAAFLIDGSWKVGGIVQACQSDPEDPSTLDEAKLDNFDVTFVPSTGDGRKTTDLVGGLSMGYYISRKAWDDADKRAAAVNFVEYMTSDEIVPVFAQHTASALNNAPEVNEADFNALQVKAMAMMANCTSLTGAVQDIFNGECRTSTFEKGLPLIVTGKVTAEDAVAEGLKVYQEQ